MKIIKDILRKYVYRDWNIAIADLSDSLVPSNIKWMKHNYTDRWFADPFIIDETEDCFIVLVEECMHATGRGRLARLYVSKEDCKLVRNETILDLPTHLSFPNYLRYSGDTYLFPENAGAGNTKYYKYGDSLELKGVLTDEPLADAVMIHGDNANYILATKGANCNGNELLVYKSDQLLDGFKEVQKIQFSDNIARRAGVVFRYKNKLVSPAQINNDDYGQGLSFQYLTFEGDKVSLEEFCRMAPLSDQYPDGFHTYNVYGNKVVIDGYRYRSPLLHKLYVKFRNPK